MEQRHDLGVSFSRLVRAVIEAETPVLERHGIEMWDYAVLSVLADGGPAPTQTELAATVGRDKTRLIPILDRLEARGYLIRTPDPADRRNRIITLADAGRDLVASCRRDIRAVEADLLADIAPRDADTFVRVLEDLADKVSADKVSRG